MEEKDIKENIENSEFDAKPYYEAIEEARSKLFKSYTLTRRITNIVMFAMVGAIAGIMFMIISNNQILKIVGYALAGTLLVGMIVYYIVSRKKFPNRTKEYMEFVSDTLRNKMFGDGFSEIKYDPQEKLELTDLAGDCVYKDATNVNSRTIVRGVYNGHHFTYAEAALLRPSTRKQQVPPLFVGRYLTMPNDLDFEGRFVFVLRNEKEPLDLPNAVDDLTVLEPADDAVMANWGSGWRMPTGEEFNELYQNTTFEWTERNGVYEHLRKACLLEVGTQGEASGDKPQHAPVNLLYVFFGEYSRGGEHSQRNERHNVGIDLCNALRSPED